MELVEVSNVLGATENNVFRCLILIINFTWPLKTQIVKTISQKNSLSMVSGKVLLMYIQFDKHIYFSHNILPIVMGARPEDYEKVAPNNSYIHVDEFKGPKELAEYLHLLDNDDDLYNQYFQVRCLQCKSFIISIIISSGKVQENLSIQDFSAEFVLYFIIPR